MEATLEKQVAEGTVGRSTMRAAVRARFGAPRDVVEVRELEKPVPGDEEVLVRVRAASLNIADWYGVVGRPWVGRMASGVRGPKETRLGIDYAGVVEAVGKDVTEFRPGDEVFGGRTGALAEYVAARADRAIVHKPPNATFEQAACVAVAGATALQGLRDRGGLQPGQKVLINGASGGVGTIAVQVAKALGGEVTGVCSTRNLDLVRSLGADEVVDYTCEDFTRGDARYDLVLDVAGSRPWRDVKRVLAPSGTVVLVGGSKSNRLLGPLGHVVAMRLGGLVARRKVAFFIAKLTKDDMELLRGFLESSQLRPAVDRQYELSEVAEAFEYMGEGHTRSKIVVKP